jgi:predicted metal-binding protein
MENQHKKPELVRRICKELYTNQLQKDLDILRSKALEMGAAEAVIVRSTDVIFNPEVLQQTKIDNSYPSFHWFLNYPKDELEEAIKRYQTGIFFRLNGNSGMPSYGGGPIENFQDRQLYFKLYEMVALIESKAFYLGYHLAAGFACGNCRSVFCSNENRCWATVKGHACLHPYKARPSMEGAGMDALAMAKVQHWKLTDDANSAIVTGLVMVA